MPGSAWEAIPIIIFGIVVTFAALMWWKRRQTNRYDLSRLRDAPRTGWYDQTPLLDEEQPDEDGLTEDSGPYCLSCDEAYPAGTSVCHHCGRRL